MSTAVTTATNPWGRVSQTRRVRVYARGRVCAVDGCTTILSIYNPSKFCSAHASEARDMRRRGVLRPIRSVACEHCGASFETQNEHRRYCSDRCRMAAFARRKRAAQRAEAQQLLAAAERGQTASSGLPGAA